MGTDINSIIVSEADILGGRPRIDGTRTSVRSIAILYKSGYSPEEVADQFEHLSLAQIYAALAYYHANRDEVDSDIASEDTEYDRLEKEYFQVQKSA